ncbi:MAG: pyridoxal-phosphate dependent enzyme [Bacteroidota bacterium]
MTLQELQNAQASPLQRLYDERWEERDVALWIKRDDLLAPAPNDPLCGNKWRKLQVNLLHAKTRGFEQLLTFGGAFSNHLAAVASAGRHFGFKTIGVVRGEPVDNPTLARAQADGMRLHFVDRTTYRNKTAPSFLQSLYKEYGPAYVLPEGGTNAAAFTGCTNLANEILTQSPTAPTYIAVACGTGGTATGLIQGMAGKSTLIGVSVLKGNFMQSTIQSLLAERPSSPTPWEVHESYHHGGYAKRSRPLNEFIQWFYQEHEIVLDPIYTGKLFYALYDLLERGYFSNGSSVVGIHTGGLQAFASSLPG